MQQVHFLTDGREKYVWFSGDGYEQFFDLVADPNELCNLAPLQPQPEKRFLP